MHKCEKPGCENYGELPLKRHKKPFAYFCKVHFAREARIAAIDYLEAVVGLNENPIPCPDDED